MGLFSHHGSSSHHEACPIHDLNQVASSPIFGATTFHRFDKILSVSCALFACVVIWAHQIHHANRYSNPGEQSKILKVSALIPLYSLFSFLSVFFPVARVYLFPWLDFFQSISLGAFFLLMCEYISPKSDQRDMFFAAMTVKSKKGSQDGLAWYRRSWILIFQYPIVSLLVAVATDATNAAGIYCEYLTKVYYAKLWLGIIGNISLSLAVMSVMKFALQLKSHLAEQKPIAKLIAFKLVVFLGFIQTIVFWILTSANVLKPTSTLTYADLNMGIPSLLTCIEMVPISIFFCWAYPVRPYVIDKSTSYAEQGRDQRYCPQSYQGGALGYQAFIDVFNPRQLIEAILFGFRMASEGGLSATKPSPQSPLSENNGYDYQDQVEQRGNDNQYQMGSR